MKFGPPGWYLSLRADIGASRLELGGLELGIGPSMLEFEAGITASQLKFRLGGWNLSLEARIWALRLKFEPGGWAMGFETGIWASRLS